MVRALAASAVTLARTFGRLEVYRRAVQHRVLEDRSLWAYSSGRLRPHDDGSDPDGDPRGRHPARGRLPDDQTARDCAGLLALPSPFL